jgi:hypothetical protein
MTPIPRAALDFVAMRRFDRSSGRFKTVDLREISEQRELYGCSRPSGGMSAIGAHHALLR